MPQVYHGIDWKKDDPLKLRFMSSFYYFMEIILKKMENKKLAKIFVNYIGSIVQSPEMKDIISSWGANWSLTFSRELTASITYGKKLRINLKFYKNYPLNRDKSAINIHITTEKTPRSQRKFIIQGMLDKINELKICSKI